MRSGIVRVEMEKVQSMACSVPLLIPRVLNRFLGSLRSRRGAWFALAFGIVTHATFAVSIIVMVFGLYYGLRTGHGPFHGWMAVVANLLLILQFPVMHSFLLSKRGRKGMAKLMPYGLGRDLATTTFVLVASLQLLATFGLWSPSGVTLSDPTGGERHFLQILFLASWVFLIKALTDSGLGLQTGYLGWSSVVKGKRPEYGDFPTRGLFRLIRHPVYLGFALILWTSPVHTLDGVLLALAWTVYCVAGPLLKEARFLEWHGERFSRYRASVPYMVPKSKPKNLER